MKGLQGTISTGTNGTTDVSTDESARETTKVFGGDEFAAEDASRAAHAEGGVLAEAIEEERLKKEQMELEKQREMLRLKSVGGSER